MINKKNQYPILYRIKDLATVKRGSSPRPINEYMSDETDGLPWLKISDFKFHDRYVCKTHEFIKRSGLKNTRYVKKGTLICTNSATPGIPIFLGNDMCLHDGFLYFETISDKLDPLYLFYFITANRKNILGLGNGSVFVNLKKEIMENYEIPLPTLVTQQKIAAILSAIDDKIELNNEMNKNLEEQLYLYFRNLFSNNIDGNSDKVQLFELIDVIDNRGKTPLLENNITNFPVIDVGALKGEGRIVNFDNCTKYVSQNTYNTFFRSGHPKEKDILLSTVGSLAELKIYFGNIGCIAQNVVAFRCKGNYQHYLYQYLKYIKNELISYNIGSVQPSIKVTHIVKHPIFKPDNELLNLFENNAEIITKKIFNNEQENKHLTELRDTLLPKLMSGEIDVSKVEVD